jgi:enoyl-CoA hydratase
MGKGGPYRAGSGPLERVMTIQLTRVDELALLTLDRPEALNALSFALLRDLAAALDQIGASDARVLLVTGAGDRAFCAGADIAELIGRAREAARAGAAFGQATLAKLDTLPIPSIALVNGYAFGGGLELALACTFRIASPGARLGLPEIKLGLIPGYGGTQRLPRLVGEARALEMILTGRAVAAEEALSIGLVNRIAEGDLVEAGLSFAREMTGYSLCALAPARDAVHRGLQTSLPQGLAIEAELNAAVFQTADATEGMTAFLDKRKPVFRDR